MLMQSALFYEQGRLRIDIPNSSLHTAYLFFSGSSGIRLITAVVVRDLSWRDPRKM
jgi:hypothetical protein